MTEDNQTGQDAGSNQNPQTQPAAGNSSTPRVPAASALVQKPLAPVPISAAGVSPILNSLPPLPDLSFTLPEIKKPVEASLPARPFVAPVEPVPPPLAPTPVVPSVSISIAEPILAPKIEVPAVPEPIIDPTLSVVPKIDENAILPPIPDVLKEAAIKELVAVKDIAPRPVIPVSSVDLSAPAKPSANMQSDIARILEDIKLPKKETTPPKQAVINVFGQGGEEPPKVSAPTPPPAAPQILPSVEVPMQKAAPKISIEIPRNSSQPSPQMPAPFSTPLSPAMAPIEIIPPIKVTAPLKPAFEHVGPISFVNIQHDDLEDDLAPLPSTQAPPSPQTQPSIDIKRATTSEFGKIISSIKIPDRNDMSGSADTPKLQPVVSAEPPAPIKLVEAIKVPSSVVPMHTFKDDLQNIVRSQNISVVKAVSMESDRKQVMRPEEPDLARKQRSHRALAILFAAALFFFLGAAALFGIYVVQQGSSKPLPLREDDSLLFAEQSADIPLENISAATLKQKIAIMRDSSGGQLGSISRMKPSMSVVVDNGSGSTAPQSRPATFQEFLQSIGSHAPDSLVRALGGTFFLGVHVVDVNAPVIIVPVASYDRAFAGMLAWEDTMNTDLSPIFTAVSAVSKTKDGVPSKRVFADDVMRNYDVRQLKDDSGNIVLYYSFPTTGILIIAQSPYSFTEVLSRLRAAHRI